MKNLNMTRFGRVLKLDFTEGMKSMMWAALAMLLLYLFFFWFAYNIGFHGFVNRGEDFVRMVCEAVGSFGCVAMMFFFLITVSTLYRSEQKKQQRIAWLMLPATNLEKFLSRWIYMLVFSLVGGVLMFFVADLIHMAWLWMSGMPVKASTCYFFNGLPHTDNPDNRLLIANAYGMMVAIHAFFLLGGVLFRKYHTIVTAALVVLIFTLMTGLYNALFVQTSSSVESSVYFDVFMIVMECCAIVLFTWLAYRLFCRWQVVTRKFVNL